MFFFQPIVPQQKREGMILSCKTWLTTFMSHKQIKLPSITNYDMDKFRKEKNSPGKGLENCKRYKFR